MTQRPVRPDWRHEPGYRVELMVGRTMAACAHPFAAWQVLSRSWRAVMVTTYAAASYLMVLTTLLILRYA